MTLVFNASPLIVLAKAGLLDRILPLGDQIWIPQAVADEILQANDPADPASCWIAGQSGVISLTAATSGAVAVLDDLAARRCGQAVGLKIVGTIGLVLMAKRAGMIPSVSRALDAIVAAGLFISPHHLDAIRSQAGE